jgi:hypothetical protein
MISNDGQRDFGPWALGSLILFFILLLGFVCAAQLRGATGAIGVCGLIFLSTAIVGALLGFIFAIPRVIARGGVGVSGDGVQNQLLGTNTNLERISDWLTTMLVGVGLSQLTNLNGTFVQFRDFLATTATVYDHAGCERGCHPSAGVLPAVGPFILILGVSCGFLFMYLVTRLVLVGFFKHSEEVLSGAAAAAVRVAVADTGGQAVVAPAPVDGGQSIGAAPAAAPITAPVSAVFLHAVQATTLSNDDALGVMFELLYKPSGYRRVIQMSAELSRTAITKRADYWFYLTAAFGQQMHAVSNDQAALRSARDNAMDCARRAVQLDKSYRQRLWDISDPDGPDDDLALLRDDPAFRRLVGR